MFTKFKIILVVLIVIPTLFSCETIRNDYDDCGVWLEFVFDYNMEYADAFDPQVKTVDVYIFDKAGKFVVTKYAGIDNLDGRKRMFLSDGLPFGEYSILTVGNLKSPFSFADIDGNPFEPGITTIEDIVLALNSAEALQEFDHLFFGSTINIRYKGDLSVWPVHLIRQTNKFNIVLQTVTNTSNGNIQGLVDPVHTVEIIAPESGAYNYQNNPLIRKSIVYQPHSLLSRLNDTSTGVLQETTAKINTMRLLEGEQSDNRIVVRDIGSGDELWSNDLLTLLAATKPNTRPDGTILPRNEYFDREGDWNIVIIYKSIEVPHTGGDPDESFVALKILINGWIVWEHSMEI